MTPLALVLIVIVTLNLGMLIGYILRAMLSAAASRTRKPPHPWGNDRGNHA